MEFKVRKLRNIELNRLSPDAFKNTEKAPLAVVLDNVRSMSNVGSVFRTCDCLGIGILYLCGITGKPPHREIHKTSLGAEQSIEWKYFEHTADAIRELKQNGYTIAALEQTDRSTDIRDFEVTGQPLAIVLGNEVEGVQSGVLDVCDEFIEIPQFGTKHSFNVAVSAGIAVWEIMKRLKNR